MNAVVGHSRLGRGASPSNKCLLGQTHAVQRGLSSKAGQCQSVEMATE